MKKTNMQKHRQQKNVQKAPLKVQDNKLDFSDAAIANYLPPIHYSETERQSEMGSHRSFRPLYEDCRYVSSSSKDCEVDDFTLNNEVEQNISAVDYVDSADVEIVVRNGEISIEGEVATEKLKRYIETQVAKTTGVRNVRSKLRMRSH